MNKVPLLLSVTLLLYSLVIAQSSSGIVSGIITDPAGDAISNATIVLTSIERRIYRQTLTNSQGIFNYHALDPGEYTLKVDAKGFAETELNNVIVRSGLVSRHDIKLAVTPVSTSVEVVEKNESSVSSDSATRYGLLDSKQIIHLPYPNKNPVSLALILPGVTSNRYAPGAATFSVNGGRQRSNSFLIDGTDNNETAVTGQGFQITNPDAVQEVSILTSNYDAEFGRAGGGIINLITKSGTNNFHGSLGLLFDSTFDDAITNTQSLNPLVQQRGRPLPGTEKWATASVGGPLFLPRFGSGGPHFYNGIGRTFFFSSYQGRVENSSSQSKVTTLSPAGRKTLQSFFNNNPRVKTLLTLTEGLNASAQFFSESAGPGRPSIEFGSGFYSYSQKLSERQVTTRVDHTINNKSQLSVRYLMGKLSSPQGGSGSATLPGFSTSRSKNYNNILVSHAVTLSNRLSNEFRTSYNRLNVSFPLDPANSIGKMLPLLQISGIFSGASGGTYLGIPSSIPQGHLINNYVLQNTLTFTYNKHTLRFGVDTLLQRAKQLAPINERGVVTYGPSKVTGGSSFTALANFIDDFGGSGTAALKDFGSSVYYPHSFRHSYFVQDKVRISSRATITLGLRYDNFGNPFDSIKTPAFTGLFNIDPITFMGPFNQPNTIDSDNNNFAPSVGLAYSPHVNKGIFSNLLGVNASVIRAGYQVGYDSFFNNMLSNAQTSSPNVIATVALSNATTSTPRGLSNFSQQIPTVPRALTPLDGQALIDPRIRNPYYQRWSLGVQRQLKRSTVIDVAYVGSKGTGLYITEDLNPSVPERYRITPKEYSGPAFGLPNSKLSGRIDNLQGGRLIRTNGGSSIYHAGQLYLNNQLSNMVQIGLSYTYSKLIDNGSDVYQISALNSQQQAAVPSPLGGLRFERAVSLFDRTHRAAFTYIFQFPKFNHSNFLIKKVLGGYVISGITTLETGVPLNVLNGIDADGLGGALDRPDFNPHGIRGVRAVPSNNSPTGYIDPDAGNSPIDPARAQFIGLPSRIGRTGNLGRNALSAPGIHNWDVALTKILFSSEAAKLHLRTELFNAFNHPQPGTPSASPFAPGQQGVSANVFSSPAGRFLNTSIADSGGRVLRYELKLLF